jgi:hypothetical protein
MQLADEVTGKKEAKTGESLTRRRQASKEMAGKMQKACYKDKVAARRLRDQKLYKGKAQRARRKENKSDRAAAGRHSLTAEARLLVPLGGPKGKTARGPSCWPSLWFGGLWPKGAAGSSASERASACMKCSKEGAKTEEAIEE